MESVNGRIIILTVSINTRKEFNTAGAPAGRRCVNQDRGNLVTAEIIKDIHKGRAKERLIVK
jgi:hypothetical protein